MNNLSIKEMNNIPIGSAIYVSMGVYRHYGIYAGGGSVIHNSSRRGGVKHEPIDSFSQGKEVFVNPRIFSEDMQGAVARAKRFLNMPYDLFNNNCEHFVHLAHSLVPQSQQIQRALIGAGGVSAALSSDSPTIRTIGGGVTLGAAISAVLNTPPAQTTLITAGSVLLTSFLLKR